MPIYAYRCVSCDFQKDHLQKLSDPQLTLCPECDKETYEKQITAAGFQLKGSGWYQSDFKDSAKKTETAAAKPAEAACAACPSSTACAASA